MKTQIKIENFNDYGRLYDLMISTSAEMEDITIELGDSLSYEPLEIIILAMAYIQLFNGNHHGTFVLPVNLEKQWILYQIGLPEFLRTNHTKTNTMVSIPSKTAMPIKRLDMAHLDSYVQDAIDFFGSNCKGKETTMLKLTIAELINNVYDHANSIIDAYIFSNYFPEKNQISIIVGDFGMGIPAKANEYFKQYDEPVRSSVDCIKWALEMNQSSFSKPHNRGKGLNNLHTFVNSSESNLRIFSNDVMLLSSKEGDIIAENPIRNFRGTIVEININIDGLSYELDSSIESLFD